MRPEPKDRLDPRAISAWRVGPLLWAVAPLALLCVSLIVISTMGFLDPIVPWIVGLFSTAATVFVVGILPSIRYARWRYEVTDDEIDLREGVLIVKRTIIPLVRVQHVDTHQGPVMRMFGLAGVKIATAATVYDIPALSIEVADRLRDRIAELARLAEEDV